MSKGRYGIHGGQYISETLMNELIHLEECYEHYKKDPEFNAELNKLLMSQDGLRVVVRFSAQDFVIWMRFLDGMTA